VTTSWQAKQVWKKFGAWYGADALERKYGTKVPDDWCDVIDGIDRSNVDRIMADVRSQFPTWLPSLPEFERIVGGVSKARDRVPSIQERLTAFVLRAKPLTPNQVRLPWRFLHTGNARTGEGFAVTGVEIPPDGDFPGYRVMVIDMQAEAA
jgi:hypothetical protein